MKIETKEIYRCDYCNKLYLRKHVCVNHEKGCRKNPENIRACLGVNESCVHLVQKDAEAVYNISYNDYVTESTRNVTLFYCQYKNMFVYPPSVEIKGNAFEIDNESNYPMPKQCNDYDSIVNDINDFVKSIYGEEGEDGK